MQSDGYLVQLLRGTANDECLESSRQPIEDECLPTDECCTLRMSERLAKYLGAGGPFSPSLEGPPLPLNSAFLSIPTAETTASYAHNVQVERSTKLTPPCRGGLWWSHAGDELAQSETGTESPDSSSIGNTGRSRQRNLSQVGGSSGTGQESVGSILRGNYKQPVEEHGNYGATSKALPSGLIPNRVSTFSSVTTTAGTVFAAAATPPILRHVGRRFQVSPSSPKPAGQPPSCSSLSTDVTVQFQAGTSYNSARDLRLLASSIYLLTHSLCLTCNGHPSNSTGAIQSESQAMNHLKWDDLQNQCAPPSQVTIGDIIDTTESSRATASHLTRRQSVLHLLALVFRLQRAEFQRRQRFRRASTNHPSQPTARRFTQLEASSRIPCDQHRLPSTRRPVGRSPESEEPLPEGLTLTACLTLVCAALSLCQDLDAKVHNSQSATRSGPCLCSCPGFAIATAKLMSTSPRAASPPTSPTETDARPSSTQSQPAGRLIGLCTRLITESGIRSSVPGYASFVRRKKAYNERRRMADQDRPASGALSLRDPSAFQIMIRDCVAVAEILQRFLVCLFIAAAWLDEVEPLSTNVIGDFLDHCLGILCMNQACRKRSNPSPIGHTGPSLALQPSRGGQFRKMAAATSLYLSFVPCIPSTSAVANCTSGETPLCSICQRQMLDQETDAFVMPQSSSQLQMLKRSIGIEFEKKVFSMLSYVDYKYCLSTEAFESVERHLKQVLIAAVPNVAKV